MEKNINVDFIFKFSDGSWVYETGKRAYATHGIVNIIIQQSDEFDWCAELKSLWDYNGDRKSFDCMMIDNIGIYFFKVCDYAGKENIDVPNSSGLVNYMFYYSDLEYTGGNINNLHYDNENIRNFILEYKLNKIGAKDGSILQENC